MERTSWIGQLDGLLRGQRTTGSALRAGIIDVPLRVFVPLAVLLGGSYGFFMGWFALSMRDSEHRMEAMKQLAASTVKLPMLFLLTLFVTFPSLYVFNALVGCRLGFKSALRLLVAAIVVNLAVGASLGPILAFFTLSTKSYAFMVLLNVVLLAIAGCVGLGFLLRTLRRIEAEAREEALQKAQLEETFSDEVEEPAPLGQQMASKLTAMKPPVRAEVESGAANGIFQIWVIIYALVGAQMSWLLRPFIGNPAMEFTLFRHRDGNFFSSVIDHIGKLFGM